MHYNYLITGTKGSIGRYLLEKLPNAFGLARDNFTGASKHTYDTIIHCAFNKNFDVTINRQYLEDNIFLTQRIIEKLNFRHITYLSSVDIYQDPPSPYSLSKQFAEALIVECKSYTILRSSTLLGPYLLAHNHLSRMLANEESIGLAGDSSFNYVLNSDLVNYFLLEDAQNHINEIVDFVAKGNLSLQQVKEITHSSTTFGKHRYVATQKYQNPIFQSSQHLNNTSEENLLRFLKESQD